ncbi:MAG: hypothetical protein ACXVCY_02435 [Pseudobdellovibrionaceae bacterium]
MKKFIIISLSALSFSNASQAWIENSDYNSSEYSSSEIEQCSDNLYVNLGIFSSAGDEACSFGRTDLAFQQCTINTTKRIGDDAQVALAGYLCANGIGATNYRLQDCTVTLTRFFGPQYRDYNLKTCLKTTNPNFGNCVVEMYQRGGQDVENQNLPVDGFRLCKDQVNVQLNQCIIDNHQFKGLSGAKASRSCLEKFDPATVAKRQAQEQLRLQEQQRQKARQQQQNQTQIQPTPSTQPSQQSVQPVQTKEKAKNSDNVQPKSSEEQKPKSTDASAGNSSNGSGGVIVDLPNF